MHATLTKHNGDSYTLLVADRITRSFLEYSLARTWISRPLIPTISSHTRLPIMDYRLEIDDAQARSQDLRSVSAPNLTP